MSSFYQIRGFLASSAGRWVRIGAGLVMVAGGVRRGGPGGAVLALVGLVPFICGVLDYCLISYLAGGPLRGEEIRREPEGDRQRHLPE